MVSQCLELFKIFYEKYLGTSFTLDHVTVGESCGSDKLSFHIMIYDGKYAWNTGLAKQPPYNSSQKTFINLMREETLKNPERWDCLTFVRKDGKIWSVIDTSPYNSKGTQSFRTLLSSKISENRVLKPFDGYGNPLPHTPETVLRGFASITKHPHRCHKHRSY